MTIPAPPGGVAATQNLTDRVRVTWNAFTGTTSYEVWRSTTTSSGSASRIGTVSGTSFDDASAVAGTNYYYWIKAGNSAGWSGFSAMTTGLRPIALTNGQTLGSRSGAFGSMTHYRINVPAGQPALIVRTWGGPGDCDIYVKYGSPASTSSHNGRSINVGNSDTVTINDPLAGDWYIMLRGSTEYSGVSLQASIHRPMNGEEFVNAIAAFLERLGGPLVLQTVQQIRTPSRVSTDRSKPLIFFKVEAAAKAGVSFGCYFDLLDFLPSASQDGRDEYVTVWITGGISLGSIGGGKEGGIL